MQTEPLQLPRPDSNASSLLLNQNNLTKATIIEQDVINMGKNYKNHNLGQSSLASCQHGVACFFCVCKCVDVKSRVKLIWENEKIRSGHNVPFWCAIWKLCDVLIFCGLKPNLLSYTDQTLEVKIALFKLEKKFNLFFSFFFIFLPSALGQLSNILFSPLPIFLSVWSK